jgi:NAD(P)-dependent dehydrogenase (short-subunit alcohol dehydrogenase family)
MSLDIDLDGRVALVTGAARGLGREIGMTLARAGAAVAFGDISSGEPVDDAGMAVTLDVTSADSASAAIAEVTARLGPVDILVNNAGVGAAHQGFPFTNQEPADWEKVMSVNAIGTFITSRAFVLGRDADRAGVIVNIASVSGRTGFQTDPGYSASKAAVINFTQCMARDLAPIVRVCAVCPGMVATAFYRTQWEAAAERDPDIAELTPEEYFERKAASLIPMRRGQRPADIASAVAFLASDLAGAITGQALNVDGGLVMC